MHTVLSRLNAVLASSLTVLAVLTFLCFLSTAFKDRSAEAHVTPSSGATVKLATEFYSPEQKDLGLIKLDISANLSHLFDWNTKQLFVLAVACYHTDRNVVNEVVLWDKIIKPGDSAVLDVRAQTTEYKFFDAGRGLKGNKNVTLQLRWNIIPHAGRLPLLAGSAGVLQFPVSYS